MAQRAEEKQRLASKPALAIIYPRGNEAEWNEPDKAEHAPTRTLTFIDKDTGRISKQIRRKFLRLRVVNTDGGVAEECTAKIRCFLRVNGCTPCSPDTKLLRWATGQLKETISAHGGEEKLDVVFADSEPSDRVPDVYCNFEGKDPHLRAWLSTPESVASPFPRVDDGFCLGHFDVEIVVRTKSGESALAKFRIHMTHWERLEMESIT